MKFVFFSILLFLGTLQTCINRAPDNEQAPLVEAEGQFLYESDVAKIIPIDINATDSAEMAQNIIRKWVTDVLMLENAKRNTPNEADIEKMVQEYRKSLIIHQYQQNLIEQRLKTDPTKEQIKEFYTQYGTQMLTKETIIKGFLLTMPDKSPKLTEMRKWVQRGDTEALENIEKYHLQNAVGYDYFAANWTSISAVLKKIPAQPKDPADFIAQQDFYEISDSTHHYLLHINERVLAGATEPYELAKDKIANILRTRMKAEYISRFETELYNDAVKNGHVKFFKVEKE